MKFNRVSEEVLYPLDMITTVDNKDIEMMKAAAAGNVRKRMRLCAHQSTVDTLHEMLIVHSFGAYVRPHKHEGKSESFHIIEGRIEVLIFDDDGMIKNIIKMGEYSTGLMFYFRLSRQSFHTVIPTSPVVVFHETTNGPFKREDTIFARWAPDENDSAGCELYMQALRKRIGEFGPSNGIDQTT